jgi:signal transduction histidine kinase
VARRPNNKNGGKGRQIDSATLQTGFAHTIGAESRLDSASFGPGGQVALFAARTFVPMLLGGLAGILFASTVTFFAYRHFNVLSSLRQSQAAAQVTAQAIVEPLNAGLIAELSLPAPHIGDETAKALNGLVTNKAVYRIRIYDGGGRPLFSTATGDTVQPLPAELRATGAGMPTARAGYRDSFGRLGDDVASDNEAMVWLTLGGGGSAIGTFEVDIDLTANANRLAEHHQLVAGGALIILLALYVAFLLGMRQIGASLHQQQESLRRNAELLPAMFRRSMHAEEEARQRMAAELEGRVAQTLATVKAELEDAAAALRRGELGAGARLDAAVPPLQKMISGVRDVAAALHRPGDGNLGLTEAIEAILGEARGRRPDIEMSLRFEATDGDVPTILHPVLRRAAESGFAGAIANGYLTRLRVLVGVEGNDVIFRLRDDATAPTLDDPDNPYARLHEHVLLSGGRIGFRANSWGGIVIRATWRRS